MNLGRNLGKNLGRILWRDSEKEAQQSYELEQVEKSAVE